MAVADFFAGEIITELLKNLIAISKKSWQFKDSANGLKDSIEQLLPIIQEIKYSGVELPAIRQFQLDRISETLRKGHELAHKVLLSSRYNIYKNLQYARKMETIEKTVAKFIQGPLQAHILADVHHIRFQTTERFDRLEGSSYRLEQTLGAMKIGACSGGGGVSWVEEAVRRVEEEGRMQWESSSELVLGLGFGLKKVKEMVLGTDDLFVGISGIGGSGKTTLVKELIKDDHVRSYFGERILFLTVSQSPDTEDLKAKILGFIMGNQVLSPSSVLPQMNFQFEWRNPTKTLVVLDDVWSLSTLQPLLFNIPGCKTLVVSRFKFQTVTKTTYDVELLGEDEAVSLFCHSAFGQKFIPPGADKKLVKQIVDECKRLPLALKVIGSSLRDQPEMIWANASKRLSRGESIGESHENNLLDRMAISVKCLSPRVRECFLDLGAFPEDKKIPLDVLINIWVETHDHIDEEQAFAILHELSDKNLVTLVKDARDGDIYSSCYDISVTQHDVLRDLALHLSNNGSVNQRSRLLMPRREIELPREWDRHSDEPFQARIVSIHTGEMTEMDWFEMEFPKAEVLILNFASNEYLLPPFIRNMPKLKALILINYSAFNAILHGFSVLSNLGNLRSLWLEKVSVPPLSPATFPSKKLRKISLILCKINNSLDQSVFPRLLELTIDHCDDLFELPASICWMHMLNNLSITNCHHLWQLPVDLSKLKSLQILRLYACPYLQKLPPDICELCCLKYLNISQCCSLRGLPLDIGKLASLEKIDMRECSQIRNLPNSTAALPSLGRVVCDEEISWFWKKALPDLHVQVAEKRFDLDWLDE
ncbi:putative powdery mildew resistance protein, RPW8 [Rosa chinensis]|uniref:Putative powdery mildew resistance protein, RPW8 n=1 Tax=Rosa chinensis TaxID=74649 RepID=A0A2P6PYB8_ROSCH|nr:probable disease resistance protein At4g33300 isoform X1 [Rosa chinensis]PRQ26927.1 putative powdery mildew resistance protein, RPW8 [Rosa chinensis]